MLKNAEADWLRVAAAVVRRGDGTVLVARRPGPGTEGGRWEFPGGKLEAGESFRQCLVRELKEELAVDIEVRKLLCVVRQEVGRTGIELVVYEAGLVSGEPAALEHAGLAWAEPAALEEDDFCEPDRPVVRLLRRQRPAGEGTAAGRSEQKAG